MKTLIHKGIRMLQFDGLSRCCNISHFITTRHGGTGTGTYTSFNLGAFCKDDPAIVRSNRRLLCSVFGLEDNRLFVPCQTHADNILYIDSSFLSLSADEQEQGLYGKDALITNQPGLVIGVTTADCVPILLYAPDQQVVAAIHAGWRGTVRQIARRTIDLLIRDFHCDPEVMIAGIGPAISQELFEVGEEVGDTFTAAGISLKPIAIRHPETGRLHINLCEANRLQLTEAGILPGHIEIAGMCTCTDADLFFSARRQGIDSGRMLSGIGITNPIPILSTDFDS